MKFYVSAFVVSQLKWLSLIFKVFVKYDIIVHISSYRSPCVMSVPLDIFEAL